MRRVRQKERLPRACALLADRSLPTRSCSRSALHSFKPNCRTFGCKTGQQRQLARFQTKLRLRTRNRRRSKRRTSSTPRISAEPKTSSMPTEATAVSTLPEVLVPLSSEAEEPFARQAIEFIYTGSLSTDLDLEALLQVRQQACYLGVKYCPQACDQAMLEWLRAGEGEEQQQGQQQQQQQQQQQEGAGTSAGPPSAEPRVLQAYGCHALFPEPGTSPDDAAGFESVRAALAKQLVAHFGDAVAALTRQDLYHQLLQLPDVAVKELLAADSFGTDTEDTVFLLLAAWLEAHEGEGGEEGGVPEETRAELCGLVRLHRLRPHYLHFVLHAYEPFSFVSRLELGCLLRYVGAGEHERTVLLDMDSKRRVSPWYCFPPRRQVVPKRGRTLEWSISREQLEQGLRKMVESKEIVYIGACFGASGAAVGGVGDGDGSSVLSDGGLWGVKLMLDPETPTEAGIFTGPTLPRQVGDVQAVASLVNIQLTVHSWAQGQRKAGFSGKFPAVNIVPTACLCGWPDALKLPPVAASGAGGEGSAAVGVEAEVAAQLVRWSEWLHEGKITGSLTFPRP